MKKGKLPPISLLKLFVVFFKVGAVTLGGGLAMLSVLRHEMVFGRKWLSDDQFSEQVTMATSIPGAIIVNFSLIHGFNTRNWKGALFSCAGVVSPSFVIMLIVAAFLSPYFDHPLVVSFLRGASASVAAIIAHTAFSLGRITLKSKKQIVLKGALTMVAVIISLAPGIHPVFAVVVGGVAGFYLLGAKSCAQGQKKGAHSD